MHTIVALHYGHANGMDFENEYLITFDYTPSAPDFYNPAIGGPGGWSPGNPAEVSFVSVEPVIGTLDAGAFTDLAQRDLDDWAKDWIDENRPECIASAENDHQIEREVTRDDELTKRF